ncbi:SMP-30/gluconolactonase/LRE family protein [Acidovorax sp. GBBC 3334]|uniref:SMP-30/gluconolactonase/LRE family protein n=1 Tax=Acidovorax sp. GBBC 3334 TaxID=2940496 RepID=UPI0023039F94|nr:SMP-30/gluconolactonase/LRE family protein [Acidovorax sp. GBBC 3334]MDA8455852.1 SMP-30/gluconolactonase/LRE family protein [Acidovorax sp. GBBC 3334]
MPLDMDWRTGSLEPDALGESPFWHPLETRLYWVDIAGRALARWEPDTGRIDHWAMPSEPGCIAPARTAGVASGLVIALRDGIYRAREWGGTLVPVATLPYDPATQRANDGRCDALGRFWVGTLHEPPPGQPREAVGALYCIDGRGSASAPVVRRMLGGVKTANGLAWSPDGRRLYWADTPTHTVRAWDCDAQGEPVGEPRVFHSFPPKPSGWQPGDPGYAGRPDGSAVDTEGHYWTAMYEGSRLLRLAPSGEIAAEVPVPVLCPTMPCLGGAAGRELFVTSARQGRPAEEIAHLPWTGFLLRAGKPAPAPGLPVAWYEEAALPAGLD